MAQDQLNTSRFALLVRNENGNEVRVFVAPSQSVFELKQQLKSSTGILPSNQSLSVQGIRLADSKSLADCGISPESVIALSSSAPVPEDKPFRFQLFVIVLSTFTNTLIVNQIYPYLSKMVMSFGLADRSTTGFYTGLITGSMMASRAVSSPIWGYVTDTWGRKPVLMLSLAFSCVVSVMFGLSTNLTLAIISRMLCGLLIPTVIVAKTCVSEVCPAHYQNRGMAWYSTARHFGAIVGYATGGALESPTWGPQLFIDYPFLLPNLFSAVISLIALIGVSAFLDETLVIKHGDPLLKETAEQPSFISMMKDNTFLLVIWTYTISSFLSNAYFDLIPLWCWAKRVDGGLEFDTAEIGYTTALCTVFLVVLQQPIYSALADRNGLRWVCLFSTLLLIPVSVLNPLISYLPNDYLLTVVMLAGSQFVWNFLDFQVLTAQFSMINNCVTKRQRGMANGLGMTVGSAGRALAPPVISACFAFTTSHGFVWPFNYTCAFNLMAFLFLVMWIETKKIPKSIEKPKDEAQLVT